MKSAVPLRAFAVALAAALILMIPVIVERPPLLAGGDIGAHAQFTRGLLAGLKQGIVYPRWLDDANYGLGAPIFIFYPPAAYYLSGLGTWLTGDVISGLNLAFAVAGIIAGLTFYNACRGMVSPRAALFGSFLYVVAPYHAWDLHCGYYAEYVAYAWLPLLWKFARRLLDEPTRRDIASLGACSAMMAVTHLPSVITVAVTMLSYAAIRASMGARQRWKSLGALAAAGGLAFLTAAMFVVPMIVERPYVDAAWVTEAPFGDYAQWLLFFHPMPWPAPFVGALLLTMVAATAVVSLSFPLRACPEARPPAAIRREAAAMGVLAMLTLFLQLQASAAAWKVVPFLPLIQFPWRFNAPHAFFCCALISLALSMSQGTARAEFWRTLGIGIAAVPALAYSLALRTYHDRKLDAHALETVNVKYQLNRTFVPRPVPRGAGMRSPEGLFPPALWDEEGSAHSFRQWRPEYRELSVSTPRPNRLEIRTFYYPGWVARLNGRVIPLDAPVPPLYLLAVVVPAGQDQKLEFAFETTSLRRGAAALTVAGLLLTGLLFSQGARASKP